MVGIRRRVYNHNVANFIMAFRKVSISVTDNEMGWELIFVSDNFFYFFLGGGFTYLSLNQDKLLLLEGEKEKFDDRMLSIDVHNVV